MRNCELATAAKDIAAETAVTLAVFASWMPARRAADVDPIEALRSE